MRRILLVAAVMFVTVVTLTGPVQAASSCEYPFTHEDATGTNVTVPSEPETIATAGPSAAQTLWEIGARDKVTGLFHPFTGFLEDSSRRTNIYNKLGDPIDLETLIALDPDVVLAANIVDNASIQEVRATTDITIVRFRQSADLGFIYDKTRTIGRFSGHCEGAESTVDDMQDRVDTIQRTLGYTKGPDAFYLLSGFGPFTAGAGTFENDVIEKLDADNIAVSAGIDGYKIISVEEVVDRDPEWIITNTETSIDGVDGLENTTAARKGNVVQVPSHQFAQPAPGLVDGMERLAEAFYPRAFGIFSRLEEGAESGGGGRASFVNGSLRRAVEPVPDASGPGQAAVRAAGPNASVTVAADDDERPAVAIASLNQSAVRRLDPPGQTVQGWQIEPTPNATVGSADLSFTVDRTVLDARNISPDDLSVFRRHALEWGILPTNVSARNGTVRASTSTPGLSVFTVAGTAPPTARITLPSQNVSAGSTARLDGSGSSARYGTIESYRWTVRDDSYAGASPTAVVDDPGEYTVGLTVTNRAGLNDTATATLTVTTNDTGQRTEPVTDEARATEDGNLSAGANATEPANGSDATDAPGAGMPGFTAVIAVLAGITAVAVIRRQR